MSTLTVPSPGPSLGSPIPSSPTGISPTYDLLGQYAEGRSPVALEPEPVHEHHAVWRQISETHENLLEQRRKDKVDPDKRLSKMRERSGALESASSALNSPNSSATSAQNISTNTSSFFDKTPALMKALHAVGEIHPFAGVAILAFRAVYELELKRRENDKKILAVYAEMRDMMAALAQLRNIKHQDELGPDGLSIKARMAHLVDQTAVDIHTCANTCDTYLKKKLVVKILAGAKWEHVLCKFAGHFHRRRSEFEFALSIHTGLGVDKANEKLDMLAETTRQMQERMDAMMEFFQSAISPEQKEVAARIRERGGVQVVLENDRALRDLVDLHRGSDGAADAGGGLSRREVAVDIDVLRLEIREDVELSVERNQETFSRKFDMQRKQIVDELSRVLHREGDRIIDAITAGPHDRIIDPDLYAIWKDMGWRGSTKARHFVLALRDYFREKMEKQKRSETYEGPGIQAQDEWALDWINVTRLQPIVEAFDDDASNFITVTEANDLTTARPRDWSLLHWLAYWAVGWQISVTIYRDKINALFAKMFSLKAHIHPAVRSSVDTYLHTVWTRVTELTSSIEPYYPAEALRERFQSHIDDEEQRLREGLEAVRYDIDAMDTLILVTGPGRIEKYVFPMIYLLLKKDYEGMRLARKNVINKDELWDAADTIGWVLQAVDFRYKDLQDIFRQQKIDPRQQFKGFACGLFEHWRSPDDSWSRDLECSDHTYNDDEEAQDIVPTDILNYPLDNDDLFDPSGYDAPRFSPTDTDTASTWPLRAILGAWSGFISKEDAYPCQPMFSLHFHARDAKIFEATSSTPNGTSFTLTGECDTDSDGNTIYNFVIKYAARFDPLYFRGRMYDGSTTLVGTWSTTAEGLAEPSTPDSISGGGYPHAVADNTTDRFIFKRLPPWLMCCRPDPIEFQINKARALWKFALTAVEEIVGKHRFTWSYFKRRRNNRKRYIELLIRLNYADLDDDEQRELARIRQTLTAADARLYETRYDYELRTTPIHLDTNCDHCESTIIGPRIICLDCDSTSSKPLNLCDDPRCRSSPIDPEKRPDLRAPGHLPTHTALKVRAMVHRREFGRTEQAARSALKKARAALEDAAELDRDPRAAATASPELLSYRAASRASGLARSRASCVVCKQRVSKPCWYCVACQDDTFVCTACDAKGPLTIKPHCKEHALVLVQDAPPAPASPLEDLARRFDATDARLGALETRFGALEARVGSVDDKLDRIEKMLEAMWSRSRKLASSRRATSVNVTVGGGMPGYPRPLPTPGWDPMPLTDSP